MNYNGPVKLTKFRHGKKDKKTGFALIENMMQTTPPALVLCHPGRNERIKRCLSHNGAQVVHDVDLFRMLALKLTHVLFTYTPKIES